MSEGDYESDKASGGGIAMLFEIINPSDTYTMESEDFMTACIAAVILGRGQYSLTQIDGDGGEKMPIFMFGGIEEWFQKRFGKTPGECREEIEPEKIADVLDSVLIGVKADRSSYLKGLSLIDSPEKRKEWRDHWHEERRTSMNDIGGRAYKLAEAFRSSAIKQVEVG